VYARTHAAYINNIKLENLGRLFSAMDLFGDNEFDEAERKSQFIFQYKCSCNSKVWWGAAKNNACKRCDKIVDRLPLEKMIGVGWFECACGRKFAGFCKGSVNSKCHGCGSQLLPSFIVPGDDASKTDKKGDRKTHHCAVCNGQGRCPIVEAAMSRGGRK
jgi:hypothetical protein